LYPLDAVPIANVTAVAASFSYVPFNIADLRGVVQFVCIAILFQRKYALAIDYTCIAEVAKVFSAQASEFD
tara:strand:+ start:710 stop:922 length:213 start_codon:yes stop_codon:yes gene_type:complete